jgi:lipopolysaccharide/colanic/teichoic acid biosynthesis glycosyltransferase
MLNGLLPLRSAMVADKSPDSALLPQELFARMLGVERKRTERSGRSFVLMLLDPGRLLEAETRDATLATILGALEVIRDTDIKGWHKDGSSIGVIFTEIGTAAEKPAVHALSTKVSDALFEALSIEEINEIKLAFHVFPEDWHDDGRGGPATSSLQIVLAQDMARKRLSLRLKRLIDIVGGLVALILCLPVMAAISIAIKLTSPGPVFFRQVRLGQYGRKFVFLKFRSMYLNNDRSIHEEYMKRFIEGAGEGAGDSGHSSAQQPIPYKLVRDPRVTPLGRFLRKTSLDEFPQFLNVLRGEMSLVGPRPPLPYEFQRYKLWHRQRLLAVKPGITGLWQVEGRSRVTFDDMVRLDIRYARSWSLWLDIKILMQTPSAVLSGNGAC